MWANESVGAIVTRGAGRVLSYVVRARARFDLGPLLPMPEPWAGLPVRAGGRSLLQGSKGGSVRRTLELYRNTTEKIDR